MTLKHVIYLGISALIIACGPGKDKQELAKNREAAEKEPFSTTRRSPTTKEIDAKEVTWLVEPPGTFDFDRSTLPLGVRMKSRISTTRTRPRNGLTCFMCRMT